MTHVKWLVRIEAVTRRFDGYQQSIAYWYKSGPDDPGEPVQRIRPRALLVPPGFPDFLSRRRTLNRGRVKIDGRAWSGMGPISRVEFGVNGAWTEATLHESLEQFAWRGWSFNWHATPGDYDLSCRATDAAGNTQPLEQPWNLKGMGNNLVQSVAVTVR